MSLNQENGTTLFTETPQMPKIVFNTVKKLKKKTLTLTYDFTKCTLA